MSKNWDKLDIDSDSDFFPRVVKIKKKPHFDDGTFIHKKNKKQKNKKNKKNMIFDER